MTPIRHDITSPISLYLRQNIYQLIYKRINLNAYRRISTIYHGYNRGVKDRFKDTVIQDLKNDTKINKI